MGKTKNQCEGCDYWRSLSGGYSTENCCHYLLDTGELRKREGDRCLSKQVTGKKRKPSFDVPPQQR